jgi:hypothetical protein
MKSRALVVALSAAVAFVQCKGSATPAASPEPRAVPPASDAAAPGRGAGPGPSVGEALPTFEAPDQDGRRHGFATLRGPNGLLLNFNRSVVW